MKDLGEIMTSSVLNVGIVGTGVGIRTLLPGFRTVSRANVIGLVGSSLSRAEKVAKENGIPSAYATVEEMCADSSIQLVCVAPPNLHHYHDVSCALQARKHVLAEKPLAMTMEECRSLRDEAQHTNLTASVDHQLRFNPYFLRIDRKSVV